MDIEGSLSCEIMEDISEEVTIKLRPESKKDRGLQRIKRKWFLGRENNIYTRLAVEHSMSKKLKEGWNG